MVLGHILAHLRATGKLDQPVLLAHVNHGIQENSDEAASLVQEQAKELGLGFCQRRLENMASDEESLRQARYQALTEMAREQGAGAVLTAHHADDNLETVLFRLLRGTGPRGLAGIPQWRRLADDLVVLRPLLSSRRQTLEQIAGSLNLTVVCDPSNQDLKYSRNRLRLQTIPALRQKLGSQLDHCLLALGQAARAATDLLEEQASQLLGDHISYPTPWRAEIQCSKLTAGLHPFLEEALQQIHQRLHPQGHRAPWTWVQRSATLAQLGQVGQRVHGASTLLAERSRSGLIILDPSRAGSPPADSVELALDGRQVGFGSTEWSLRGQCLPQPPLSPSPNAAGPQRALLQQSMQAGSWKLRRRRSGDRFWPLGMPAPVDLRRFLQNRHLPRFDRDRLPLLVDAEDNILWIPGVEIAEPAKVTLQTTACVELWCEVRSQA